MIDMLESAINVWSDSCVAAVVDKKVAEQAAAGIPMPEVPYLINKYDPLLLILILNRL